MGGCAGWLGEAGECTRPREGGHLGVELVGGQALEVEAGALVQDLGAVQLLLRHSMLHELVHNDGHGQVGV